MRHPDLIYYQFYHEKASSTTLREYNYETYKFPALNRGNNLISFGKLVMS